MSQAYLYTSGAASFGRGERGQTHKSPTEWVPGPNNYNVTKNASENTAPKAV